MTKKKLCVVAGAVLGVVFAAVAAKRARGLYDVPDRDS